MKQLKIIELFGGIGAFTQALKKTNIPFEIIDYVEIDKYAVKSYNAINETSFSTQNIVDWDKDVTDIDILMHGSPCQDFSIAGYGKGGDEGSGTRSSLMYETLRIVDKVRPKTVVWENVKGLLAPKHKHNFESYLKRMSEMGYTSYYQILDAKDYGIPQHRERIFTVSILGQHNKYEFPKKIPLTTKLKDLIEVNETYLNDKGVAYVTNEYRRSHKITQIDGEVALCVTTQSNWTGNFISERFQMLNEYDEGISRPIKSQYYKTAQANFNYTSTYGATGVKVDDKIRKLTPLECWRLMGFDDDVFYKAQAVNSNTQLYKQAGNSIVVNILFGVISNLLKSVEFEQKEG